MKCDVKLLKFYNEYNFEISVFSTYVVLDLGKGNERIISKLSIVPKIFSIEEIEKNLKESEDWKKQKMDWFFLNFRTF